MSIRKIKNKDNSISFESRIYIPKKLQDKIGKIQKTKNFQTEKEAEKWEKDILQEMAIDDFSFNDKMTFQNLSDEFIKFKKEKWSKNTMPTFDGFVKNYFIPFFKNKYVKDLSKFDLIRFGNFLDKQKKKSKPDTSTKMSELQQNFLTEKTKHNVCTALRSIIKFAIQKLYIEDSALLLYIPVYPQQYSDRQDYYLTVFQCIKLVEFVDIEIIRDIILFLFNTGLRISELCGLRFCDIDLVNELLTVNNQIFWKKGKWNLVPVKCRKGKRPDKIIINSIALNIIAKYKKLKNADNIEFVFTDLFNRPFRKDGLIKFHFDKAVKKLKEINIINQADKITLHTLRHSFITNLSMKNENPKKLQELARHKDFAFTYNRYVAKDLSTKPQSLIELENDFNRLIR
ncbi:MAG: site-specific integrase [Spirochaetes bacterium]|nr:site-specific integrase [Spirochaetota bacterium]